MGILAKDRFADLLSSSAQNARIRIQTNYVLNDGNYRNLKAKRSQDAFTVDREAALLVYDQIRDIIKRDGWLPAKYLRPWDIDPNIYEGQDRDQPWWGFEFETGYKSREARGEVIEYVWDNWDKVVFDSEGEGEAPVEITFAPEEMGKYLDGTAQACQFVRYLESVPELTQLTGAMSVGTHINISLPKFDNFENVAYCLARTVAALPIKNAEGKNVRNLLFGRDNLYGGFFPREGGGHKWIEGKLFRTVYTYDQFQMYIKVAEALTKVAQVFNKKTHKKGEDNTDLYVYCSNLYDVIMTGAEPLYLWEAYVRGGIDGTRGNGVLNGTLAPDYEGPAYNAYDDEDDDDYEDDQPDLDGPYDGDRDGYHWCDGCEVYHAD